MNYNLSSGCTGEDDGCCTADTRCGEQEGDCDLDSDCAEGLKCGHENCVNKSGLDWEPTDDCCYKPGRTTVNVI